MDYGHKQTDVMLRNLEKRIQKVYAQAARETEEKLKKHLSGYESKYEKKLAELMSGNITTSEFLKWNQGQVMIGKRWQEMRDTLATDMANADNVAMSIVNGYLPEVYALNHNYGTFEVEKGARINTSYTLYDRQTVERLVRNDPQLIPSPKLDRNKDIRWNKSRFNAGITQGILQGESLDKIARRVALGMSNSDYKAALRNARTATTGAENAGRLDSYERADRMGIKVKKVWMATLDSHTRDSHALLDGEKVDYDEPFSNGLMYPGDTDGDDPAEIWNCRCTMIADVDGTVDMSDMDWRNNSLGDMTYEEWKEAHETNQFQDEEVNNQNVHGYNYGEKTVYPVFTDDGVMEHSFTVTRENGYAFPDGTMGGVYQKRDADVYELDNGVKIIYPSDVNLDKQPKTPDMIMESIYGLPSELQDKMQRTIHVVDYDNPQDKKWEKMYNIKGFKSYATGGDEITFYASEHTSDLVGTIAHESGHYIDNYLGDSYVGARISGSFQWRSAVEKDLADTGHDAPTEYARQAAKSVKGNTKYQEDFAESVGAWARDKEKFREEFPNRCNLVEGYVEGWLD